MISDTQSQKDPIAQRRFVIEQIDDQMAAVMRQKTGAQRLRIVDSLYNAAWRLIECNVRQNHPDWNDKQVRRAVAGRIADAADGDIWNSILADQSIKAVCDLP